MLMSLLVSAVAAPPISGSFVPDLPQADLQARAADALDRSVKAFPGASRGFARPRLVPQTYWCDRITLEVSESTATVQCAQNNAVELSLDGPNDPFTMDDGRVIQPTVTHSEQQLNIRWTSEGGARATNYTFREGGFDVLIEVTNPRMPEPMAWTVPYRRAD